MTRGVLTLIVAGLLGPVLGRAAELPIPELASAPFVSGAPIRPLPGPLAAAPMTLRLAWLDPAGAAAGSEAAVEPEVTRLLSGLGIETSWRRATPSELAVPGELRVIFLNSTVQREHGANVMGATPTRFHGAPLVWVHVPSVRAAVGIDGRAVLDVHSQRRLGVALARVIGHEVVHVLAPSLPHGSGLMSARFDRRMLTASTIAVDPQLGFAVREALALGAPAMSPTDGAVVAVETAYKEPLR